jgi:hypothetical protein
MLEAEAQLRRGLRLISELPDSRERKQQELDLQVTLAAALRESKGHVHPEVVAVLGRARELIIETEATDTILHFSVLYGLWVARYLGGEPVAALDQGKEFLSLAQSQTQSGLLLVGHRPVGSSLLFTGNYRRRYRGHYPSPRSTGSLRSGLAQKLALPLCASGRGHSGTAAAPIRREELSMRGSGMPDNPFIVTLSPMPLSIRV